jgi:hypothetical protein
MEAKDHDQTNAVGYQRPSLPITTIKPDLSVGPTIAIHHARKAVAFWVANATCGIVMNEVICLYT